MPTTAQEIRAVLEQRFAQIERDQVAEGVSAEDRLQAVTVRSAVLA